MKHGAKVVLSIGVSFAILALLIQTFTLGIPEGQRPKVFATLTATSLSLVLAYLILYLIALLIRAHRYRLLLRVSGESNVPSFKQMVLVTGVRNMLVDMLPTRLGELGYIGLLNRGYGVALSHSTSSLSISIVFDLIAVSIVIMLIVLRQLLVGELQSWAILASLTTFSLCIIAVVGLFYIAPFSSHLLVSQIIQSKPQLHPWLAKGIHFSQEFSHSLLAVRGAGQTVQLLFLSVLIRALKYIGLYILFRAVSSPSFTEIAELPIEQVLSALIGGELGASLPIPTFMSFGAYEAGAALVFKILGVSNQAASLVTLLCVHIWSQVIDYSIGGTLLVLFILIQRQAMTFSTPMVKWAALIGGSTVFVMGFAFFALELRAAKKREVLSAPSVDQVADDIQQWKAQSKQSVSTLDGFIVFSSNRDGNHDIFKLNFADFELSKLTNHEHAESYPRISPDGRRLLFSRAHQPRVSLRNLVEWDVYLLDFSTGIERKVGANGTAPQWLDSDRIYFLQGASKVIEVDLDTLKTRSLFETAVGNSMPVGSHIHDPKINTITGQIAFTTRQSHIGLSSGHWGTAIADGKQIKGIYNGCELSWSRDGKRLYQVSGGGQNGGLRIVQVEPNKYAITTMIDLEGEFSHEYWPKESENGEYIVFGASRGADEHEHDTQDYELFLWQAGSDSSKAIRLTFHTGNDNWPDVYLQNN